MVRQLSEAQKEKMKNNNLELISVYEGVMKPGIAKCLGCGGTVESPEVNSLLNGRKPCRVCKPNKIRNRKRTTESYCEEIKDKNIIGEFKGVHVSTDHQCLTCNYQWNTKPNFILNVGIGCPSCNGRVPWTTERFENFLKDVDGYQLVGKTEIKNQNDKCEILHTVCGSTYSTNAVYFVNKSMRCPYCTGHERWNVNKYRAVVEANEGYKLIEEKDSINATSQLEILHEDCGNTFSPRVDDFYRKGGRCPNCRFSRGEKLINDTLLKYQIENSTQYKFPDCKHINPLPFDSSLMRGNKLIALIEYDGIQHFEAVRLFGGEETFRLQQIKDKIKNVYCFENHIPLLRIPYFATEAMAEAMVYSELAQHDLIDESEAWEEYYQQEEGRSYQEALGLSS